MINQNSTAFRLGFLILLAVCCSVFAVSAQDKKTAETTDEAEGEILVAPMVRYASPTDDDDSKVTGATVRGRLVYEDTNRPLRYAMIALTADKQTFSQYNLKFVKTDENGNFVIRNVKAGIYTAYVKSPGILNQDSYKFSFRMSGGENPADKLFEKIEIGGLGDFQIVVTARRGAAISGRILYSDGEAAVGVKVEALQKVDDFYSNVSSYNVGNRVGVAETDDRGFYRITGLPEGQYIVRVIEPISHGQNSAQYGFNIRDDQGSILRTYYPEGTTSNTAKEFEMLLGQEQSGVDITLPERRLFTLSGKVSRKKDGAPIENFLVSFYPLSERDERVRENLSGNSTTTNKNGEWTLKGLPKGKYRISITQGYVYTGDDDKQKKEVYPNMSREIEIADENLADVNFAVPSEASLSGTIVAEGGKDVPDEAQIIIYNEETREPNFSGLDFNNSRKAAKKETSFRIGKISEGKYRLAALNSQNYYIKSAKLGGRDVLNSPFEIKEGEALTGLQIVVSTNMGTVRGKVSDYDGKQEAMVAVIESGAVFGSFQSNFFSTVIKPNGDFELKAAPGEYSVIVIIPKNRPKTLEEMKIWFDEMIKNGQKISVKDNETTSVSLKMPN